MNHERLRLILPGSIDELGGEYDVVTLDVDPEDGIAVVHRLDQDAPLPPSVAAGHVQRFTLVNLGTVEAYEDLWEHVGGDLTRFATRAPDMDVHTQAAEQITYYRQVAAFSAGVRTARRAAARAHLRQRLDTAGT